MQILLTFFIPWGELKIAIEIENFISLTQNSSTLFN